MRAGTVEPISTGGGGWFDFMGLVRFTHHRIGIGEHPKKWNSYTYFIN